MNRDFAKKVLAKCKATEGLGPAVEEYVGQVGEDQALKLMESYRDILWTPGAFKETERFLEKSVRVFEAGPGSSATGVFSVLGVTALIQEAYKLPQNSPLLDSALKLPSKTFAEPHAWTGQPDYPKPLADGEEPDLTKLLQRSGVWENWDFGLAFSIPRRAIDDDQVGQLARIPTQLGNMHKRQEEVYMAGTLTGAAFTGEPGISVPAQTYTDPDGTTGVYTATTTSTRCNAITNAVLSPDSFLALLALTKKIRDWDGKTFLVTPDILVGGVKVTPKAATVLHSQYWPGISNTSGASSNFNNGVLAINPIDPKYSVLRAPIDYQEEPYFNSTNYDNAWFMIQSGKANGIGLCLQDRQPLEVLMEAPNAGQSIRTRSYYHRTYRRFRPVIAESRYVFRGNDGSAS